MARRPVVRPCTTARPCRLALPGEPRRCGSATARRLRPSDTEMTPRIGTRTARRGLFLALQLAVLVALPCASLAGSRQLPPDVDLDPDRAMSFGRMPKTSFDRRVF